MTLGESIFQLRRKKNWSQSKFAEALGIHMRNIAKYEKDLATPSALVLKKIAEVFEVSADYLLFGDTDSIAAAKVSDRELLKDFEEIEKLDKEDKEFVKRFLQMVKAKNKLKQLSAEI